MYNNNKSTSGFLSSSGEGDHQRCSSSFTQYTNEGNEEGERRQYDKSQSKSDSGKRRRRWDDDGKVKEKEDNDHYKYNVKEEKYSRRRRSRSRSRSPRPASTSYHNYQRHNTDNDYFDSSRNSKYDNDNDSSSTPSYSYAPSDLQQNEQNDEYKMNQQGKDIGGAGISIKLIGAPPKKVNPATVNKPKPTVASVFNPDSDSEPEEMPAECKMRMKNIGRDTPTSSGPNSFGKTKIGFCNVTHISEKLLEEQLASNSRE